MICENNNCVLVIIDVQEKLARTMPTKVFSRLRSNTNLLITAASALAVPVLYTLQYPQGLGGLDTEIQNALPNEAEPIEKTCFSCAGVDQFNQKLEQLNRKQICLVGMEAHICVLQTAMDLNQFGYQVFTIEDAICSRSRDNYENAINRMRQDNISTVVTESILFEWLRDSKNEHFKSLSKLIV